MILIGRLSKIGKADADCQPFKHLMKENRRDEVGKSLPGRYGQRQTNHKGVQHYPNLEDLMEARYKRTRSGRSHPATKKVRTRTPRILSCLFNTETWSPFSDPFSSRRLPSPVRVSPLPFACRSFVRSFGGLADWRSDSHLVW